MHGIADSLGTEENISIEHSLPSPQEAPENLLAPAIFTSATNAQAVNYLLSLVAF